MLRRIKKIYLYNPLAVLILIPWSKYFIPSVVLTMIKEEGKCLNDGNHCVFSPTYIPWIQSVSQRQQDVEQVINKQIYTALIV
jgi:hypothetical protein